MMEKYIKITYDTRFGTKRSVSKSESSSHHSAFGIMLIVNLLNIFDEKVMEEQWNLNLVDPGF